MLARIRKRLTYANVAMTLTLMFAISGGAYAASKYLITSMKQISPKVLKSLQGKTGKTGPAGATGPAGPAGPTGPAGGVGPAGPAGTNGTNGTNGENGKEGSPWTAKGTLPKGSSETGTWTIAQPVEGDTAVVADLSFPVSLAKALTEEHVHYFAMGASPPAGSGCNGSFEKPEAESGNLCIFTKVLTAELFTPVVIPFEVTSPESSELGAGRSGAYLFKIEAFPKEEIFGVGDWVVTG